MAKPVTREWLEEQYIIKKLNTTEIGILVKRDPKSVWHWLKDYGIPTRPRGGKDHRQSFVVGHITSPERKEQIRLFMLGNTYAAEFAAKHPKEQKAKLPPHRWTPEERERLRQTRIMDGHVPYLKNGSHWLTGKPRSEHPSWKGGITKDRQVFYCSPEWKACAKAVWSRDAGNCQRCGLVAKSSIRFDLHHVDSFVIIDRRADPLNIILLCVVCHYWAHSNKNTGKVLLGKGHRFNIHHELCAL